MTPRSRPALVAVGGARAIAAAVVQRVLDDGAYVAPALQSALSSSRLDARDRAFCTELAYGTLRWAAPLEDSLRRGLDKPGRGLDSRVRPHVLVAAYQLQHLGERVPAHAAVSEAVEAVKAVRPQMAGLANALLRKLGSAPHEQLRVDATLDDMARAFGVPLVLASAVAGQARTPEEARAALAALNGRPPVSLVSFDGAAALPDARRHPFVPNVFLVDGGGAVPDLPGFAEGTLLPMDAGSAVCAHLVAPRPGSTVLDLCAAPGGKTMLLSRDVGPSGRVVSVEKHGKRAERIRENAARLRLPVEVTIGDVLELALPRADAVLLDAPCTGLGTTRRKPEIKLRRTDADVLVAAELQRKLLASAAELVKPGGVLVYAVCSPLPAEGRVLVDAFLHGRSDFTLAPARAVLPWLPLDAVDEIGCVTLRTHLHETDGFFAARLQRAEDAR